jgi:hypothetical protein
MSSEWAASATARAFGVRFTACVNEASLLPALLARLPPCTRPCRQRGDESFSCAVVRNASSHDDEQTAPWHVWVSEGFAVPAQSEEEALDTFEGIVRFEVALRAPRWTFVHAGVVGWQGRAILLPGYSLSGKSTLVHALVRAGATYYSDEFAVLDQRGLVYPFAKPLTLRLATGGVEQLTADELGVRSAMPALPVGLVVSTRYVAGADWNPAAVSPGEALTTLLRNAVRAQVAPGRVMRVLAHVAESAETLEGPRGESASIAEALLGRASAWTSESLRNIA